MSTTVRCPAILLKCLLASLFVFFSAVAAVVHAAGAAMVTDLQGKVTIREAGRSFEASLLAEIQTGAQVQLPSGATLVVLYLSGGDEYVFKGPAQIVFRAAQPEVTSGAAPEKRSPILGTGVRIKPVGMGQGALVMRGGLASARIKLLTLSGTRVLETQPEFRWRELQPGVKYQIEIADDTGRSLVETQVEGPFYKLPVDLHLKEGSSYSWEVSARLPDGRKYSSLGDFTIATADIRTQVAAMRAAPSAPVASRVAYAAWLDTMELKDEARKYWRALSVERPEDARLRVLAGN